jgi:hypothetical protein
MKIELLHLDSANKPSPISDGVTRIWINNQPCKGINLTTRYTQARRTPRVAIVHDAVKETIRAHLTLVHIFHAYASTDTLWVAHALSHYTSVRYGRIASVSAAHYATQFGDFICHVCVSTFQMLVHSDPIDADLNWLRRGLPPWSSKYQIRPLPSFPSNILHFLLIAPSGLQLCHSINYSSSQPSNLKPGNKSPKSHEWSLPLDFYQNSIH